ncbi:hypothetical protein HDV05_007883 [Chytridiales sp. JEL 0842]|nr:hypothetical protein HDV05_007883 [Chytridiales sp. JEL 0842]
MMHPSAASNTSVYEDLYSAQVLSNDHSSLTFLSQPTLTDLVQQTIQSLQNELAHWKQKYESLEQVFNTQQQIVRQVQVEATKVSAEFKLLWKNYHELMARCACEAASVQAGDVSEPIPVAETSMKDSKEVERSSDTTLNQELEAGKVVDTDANRATTAKTGVDDRSISNDQPNKAIPPTPPTSPKSLPITSEPPVESPKDPSIDTKLQPFLISLTSLRTSLALYTTTPTQSTPTLLTHMKHLILSWKELTSTLNLEEARLASNNLGKSMDAFNEELRVVTFKLKEVVEESLLVDATGRQRMVDGIEGRLKVFEGYARNVLEEFMKSRVDVEEPKPTEPIAKPEPESRQTPSPQLPLDLQSFMNTQTMHLIRVAQALLPHFTSSSTSGLSNPQEALGALGNLCILVSLTTSTLKKHESSHERLEELRKSREDLESVGKKLEDLSTRIKSCDGGETWGEVRECVIVGVYDVAKITKEIVRVLS